MPDRDYITLVADMVKECENYRDTLSADRIKAQEYYDGIMKDTPSDKGRSSVVSRDVRETVQKVLPALSRVFLASDQVVEYQPVAEGDEEQAEQATDYINHVIFPECGGEQALTDSMHDALKMRNGVLTWYYEEKTEVKVSKHTGLDENSYATLVNEEGVEVLEHTARPEQMPDGTQAEVHDLKIRRKIVKRAPCVECRPMDEFLIHPDALTEDTAPCIGFKTKLRRTDLVAMGYDKAVVAALPVNGSDGKQEEAEEITRRTLLEGGKTELAPELQEIDYFELHVRIDVDGDGIAELRRQCYGGQVSSTGQLYDEEADEVPIAIIAAKRRAHQWEGISVSDDVMDIQRVKTVLLRGTLDNLYWQNNPQIGARQGAVVNVDALTNPQFGQTIWFGEGVNVRDAIQPILVPFVAKESYGMLEYMDREKQGRTGINDASGGLPPDALQNVTAKASSLMEQQGIGQSELMARTLAQGFERMFAGLLRLVIKHQDKPRTIRLRDKWVTFDPRQWNAAMDCTVNTGLGAGTRERDMATLFQVLQLQEKVVAGLGQMNPYVTPENIGNTLFKLAESAGLKSPRLYFSKPTPEQIQQMMEGMQNKPDPVMQKVQAEVEGQKEMEAMRVQSTERIKMMEIEKDKAKEIAQSQAAVEERTAIVAIESADKDKDRALKKYEIDEGNKVKWAQVDASRAASEASLTLKRERSNSQAANVPQ